MGRLRVRFLQLGDVTSEFVWSPYYSIGGGDLSRAVFLELGGELDDGKLIGLAAYNLQTDRQSRRVEAIGEGERRLASGIEGKGKGNPGVKFLEHGHHRAKAATPTPPAGE
jgi:hypothetical protein